MSKYATFPKGGAYTPEYRCFFKSDNKVVSPWHDIPLYHDKEKNVFNMVVEVPRWSNAKMEIATGEKMNPIKQDVKKGKLRYVHNVFPHKGYIWNYGALPQTWEDPSHKNPDTGANGDNDPLDVCEIGSRVANRGDVLPVKVLGVLAMIDEGETDWKVIVIDVNDPMAESLNNIQDVESKCPGLLTATVEWFKWYKVPDGKPTNSFAFNDTFKDSEYALNVIKETNKAWEDLMKNGNEKLALSNTSQSGNHQISGEDAEKEAGNHPESAPDAAIPDSVATVHYIKK